MNKKIFWSFQAAYWSMYYLYTIFVVHYNALIKEGSNPVLLLGYLFLLCFFGIPLSLTAQKIIDHDRFNALSIAQILTVVTIISFILANIWVMEIIILDKFFKELLDFFTITRYRILPFKWRVYFWEMFFAMLLLFAWIAIYLFLKFWNQWNIQRFETDKANLQLQVAQLKMLESQISPHFLFNALSSLRALIRKDAHRAEEMLSKISDFLRYSLINRTNMEVPFSQELIAAQNYFSIEKVRFGNKLQVDYSIDPATADFPVPGFILHPVIENSVKYGMETGKLPLNVQISATVISKKLRIEVRNSGHWQEDRDPFQGTGTGLKNLKNRLETMYPGRHHFAVQKNDRRVIVVIEIERKK